MGSGRGPSVGGGQSSDYVTEEGDGQSIGGAQSGGDAPEVGPGNLDGIDLVAEEDQFADDAVDNENMNCEYNFNSREDNGAPGPDGESNENDNSNAGHGIDNNDREHPDTRAEDENNDSKQDNGWVYGGEHEDGYGPGSRWWR